MSIVIVGRKKRMPTVPVTIKIAIERKIRKAYFALTRFLAEMGEE
jgi:hypothetical protein